MNIMSSSIQEFTTRIESLDLLSAMSPLSALDRALRDLQSSILWVDQRVSNLVGMVEGTSTVPARTNSPSRVPEVIAPSTAHHQDNTTLVNTTDHHHAVAVDGSSSPSSEYDHPLHHDMMTHDMTLLSSVNGSSSTSSE